MSLPRRTRTLIPLAAAALAALAACSDGTGPSAPLDPAAARADAQAMMDAFNAPTLQQYQVLGEYFDVGSAPVAAAVRGARELLASGRVVTSAQLGRVSAAVARGFLSSVGTTTSVASRAASLPADALGTTFVFDASLGQYVRSDRTGAPSNGVRFVLYAIDPITQDPVVTSEVGYVDVIDLNPSGTNSAGIRLLVVGGGTTYLDYSVTATAGTSSGTVAVSGYLTDGATRVNFNTAMSVTQLADGSVTMNVDYAYDVPSRQFGVRGKIEGLSDVDSSSGRITLTVTSRGATVRYVLEGDGTTLNVAVYVNNRLFATITDDGNTVSVQGAGGRQLTPDETQTLRELLSVAQYSFIYWLGLMAPAGMLGV
jgi:hypothetical protein